MLSAERKILIISSAVFLALMFVAFMFLSEIAIFVNFVMLAVLSLMVPYSFHKFLEFRKIKSYEKEFPNFLRDIAEAQRAGLSIVEAIRVAAKSDYGRFTEDVKKINNHLSWNIPLEKVLANFRKRMYKSKTITRSLLIINIANKSGGNIEDVMESLATNIEMIKDVEEEKATLMNQHVGMIYAIFFIFLGISIVLVKFMIPMLNTQADTGASSMGLMQNFNTNPCYECIMTSNPSCLGCNIFFGISDAFDFGSREESSSYYRSLSFAMVMMQGLFSGLIAGQIGSDSIAAGVKHSFIMALAGFLVFISVVKIGFI